MKILIIGHARHGKDTVAEFIEAQTGLSLKRASLFAAEKFIFDALKGKCGYNSAEECFMDRASHRKEWFNLIHEYNKGDLARFARELMQQSNMYAGMRDFKEISACKKEGLFDLVIGVFDPRKELEPPSSFNVDIFKASDLVVFNNGSLEELEGKVKAITKNLFNGKK